MLHDCKSINSKQRKSETLEMWNSNSMFYVKHNPSMYLNFRYYFIGKRIHKNDIL